MKFPFVFDIFGRSDMPVFTLAHEDMRQIAVIIPLEPSAKLRYNSLSEVVFRINGTPDTEHYFAKLRKRKLIKIEGFGWWMITRVTETNNGVYTTKEVECKSYQASLNRSTNLDAGTYQFYDLVNPDDTLLGKLLAQYPRWSVGQVSAELLTKHRTFDMPNTTTLEFMYNDVEEAYQCIFDFDTTNFKVNAYTPKEAVHTTSIVLDFRNVMKSVEIAETDDKIVTCLTPMGASEFSIHSANPLGAGSIYDFSYYYDDMPPGLKDAVIAWQSAIDAAMGDYSAKLTEKHIAESALLAMYANQSKMVIQQASGNQVVSANAASGITMVASSIAAVESIKSWILSLTESELENKLTSATGYPAINFKLPPSEIVSWVNIITANETAQIQSNAEAVVNVFAAEVALERYNAHVDAQRVVISGIQEDISAINASLQMELHFTPEQLENLDAYLEQSDYTNEHIVKLDSMTAVEIQDLAEELLADGREVLAKVSKPTYTFSMDLVNYLFLKEFEPYVQETQLGCSVLAEIADGDWVEPVLLEVEFAWESPSKLNMTFGNRFRLQDRENMDYDFFNETSRVSGAVSTEYGSLIRPSRDGTITQITEFMDSALDTAKNAVLSGEDQVFTIDSNGLTGRQKDPLSPTGFRPEQIKVIGSAIAFTDDNWTTCKTALGKIASPDGSYTYGLVAESVYGNLIAGADLHIMNDAGNFLVSETGLSYTNQSEGARIISNPSDGFRLQAKNDSDEWVDKIALRMDGTSFISDELVYATEVGGWVNDKDKTQGLHLSGTQNFARLGGSDYAFSAGIKVGEATSTKFSVDYDGVLRAENAVITGTVNATSGSFTGDISANGLKLTGGTFEYGVFNSITANTGTVGGWTILPNMIIGGMHSEINSGKIVGSSIYGTNIYGTTIYGSSGIHMGYNNGVIDLYSPSLLNNGVRTGRVFAGLTGTLTLSDSEWGGSEFDIGVGDLGMSPFRMNGSLSVNGYIYATNITLLEQRVAALEAK